MRATKKIAALSAACAALAIGAETASAATTQITPARDAHVNARMANVNFGRSATLQVGGPASARGYLRFNVPSGSPVTAATLELRARRGKLRGLEVRSISNDFNERTLTYRKAAKPTGPAVAAPRRAGKRLVLVVTPLVAGGPITLVFTSDKSRTLTVWSGEAKPHMRPRLAVTTADPPPFSPAVPLPPIFSPPQPQAPVANAAPVVQSVTIAPSEPHTNDTLTATAKASDADGDTPQLGYQWLRNGTAIAGATGATLDLAGAGHGDRGDKIAVRVTATDHASATHALSSEPVTVANSAPTVGSVTIAPGTPHTTDTLTATAAASDADGDTPALGFQWLRNGTAIAGATGATLDLAGAGHGDRGDKLAVRVTARDDAADGEPKSSDLVTVANSAPVAAQVAAAVDEDQSLELAFDTTDADQDARAITLTSLPEHGRILDDGEPVSAVPHLLTGTAEYESAPDYAGTDSFLYKARDDQLESAPAGVSITVLPINDAPVVQSVTIAPSEPRTTDTLTATAAASDADGDTPQLGYQWLRNGTAIAGATGATLDLGAAGHGDRGDKLEVRVTATDDAGATHALSSEPVTVANSAPVVESVTIAPGAPHTNATLTATAAASDADGDTPALGYQWLRNGTAIAGATAATLDLAGAGHGDRGDKLEVRVTATDDAGATHARSSDPVTIANSVPICTGVVRVMNEDGPPFSEPLLPRCVDADGDPLTHRLVGTAKFGSASISGGQLSYTPDPDANGFEPLSFVASDGTDESEPKTVALTVFAVNDPPTAVDDKDVAKPGETVRITVTTNDAKGPANESDQTLRICPNSVTNPPVTDPSGGTAIRFDDTRVSYTPDPGFDGVDTFEYQVCDNGFPVKRDTATVSVTVVRTVSATVETAPVPNSEDAADDPAVWVHPTDPSKSTIIGTDKQGGVAVYDLAGTQLQYLSDGRMNNVDLRQDITVGDWSGTLVAVSNRSAPFRVNFYRVDPATGLLEPGGAGSFQVPFEPYGLCLYHSPTTGNVSVVVTEDNSETGHVEQWTVSDSDTPGQLQASLARSIEVGSLVEGCVADDDLGRLYLAEEDVGIWRYDPEPDAGNARVAVDRVFPMGNLDDDVEGLAIAEQLGGEGHLVASSQGDDAYTIYARDGANEFERAVQVVATSDGAIDGTEDTDGIEVSTANLGPAFPSGVFVAQDGTNQTPTGVANQNFKLVPLQLLLGP